MKSLTMIALILMVAVVSRSQNVGIGTTTPGFPLNFATTTGDKISLYGNSGDHYGFGIQHALLQIHSDAAAANIGFGYGSSANFTERMRIINSGLEGMTLDGRLTIRNGVPSNPGGGGGVWLTKPDNTALLGFMGTQNSQNIGFFGGSGGWGFTYNAINSRVGIGNNNPNAPLAFGAVLGKKITLYPGATGDAGFGVAGNKLQIFADNPNAEVAIGYDVAGTFNERFSVKPSGALALSGNVGNAGQVLTSNGSNGTAFWSSPTVGTLYVAAQNGASGEITPGNTVDIPGLVANFTLTAPSRVLFQFKVRLANNPCFTCGLKTGFVNLVQNIVGGTQFIMSAVIATPNGMVADAVSGPVPIDLAPGTYSFKLVLNSPSDTNSFGVQTMYVNPFGYNRLTWQIFPQ